MNIGDRIKELRTKANLSNRELASLAGLSQPVMNRLENNERSADIETLEKVCAALNITIIDFFKEDISPDVLTPELTELINYAKFLHPDTLSDITNMVKNLSKNYKLVERNVNGDNIKYIVDLNVKPNGLTPDEETRLDSIINKLERLGNAGNKK